MRALMLMEWFGIILIVLGVLWLIWKQVSKFPAVQVWFKKSEIEGVSDLVKDISKIDPKKVMKDKDKLNTFLKKE